MALLIRGGRVLAGAPATLRRADVLIEADRIAALGLGDAAGRERIVGPLDGARGVAERLAVADQEDQITRSRRRLARSAAV